MLTGLERGRKLREDLKHTLEVSAELRWQGFMNRESSNEASGREAGLLFLTLDFPI